MPELRWALLCRLPRLPVRPAQAAVLRALCRHRRRRPQQRPQPHRRRAQGDQAPPEGMAQGPQAGPGQSPAGRRRHLAEDGRGRGRCRRRRRGRRRGEGRGRARGPAPAAARARDPDPAARGEPGPAGTAGQRLARRDRRPDADDLRPPWSGFDPEPAARCRSPPTIAGESALGAGWAGGDPVASTGIPDDPRPRPRSYPEPGADPRSRHAPMAPSSRSRSSSPSPPTPRTALRPGLEIDPEPLFGQRRLRAHPVRARPPGHRHSSVEFDADPLASFGLGGGGSAGPLPPPPPAAGGRRLRPAAPTARRGPPRRRRAHRAAPPHRPPRRRPPPGPPWHRPPSTAPRRVTSHRPMARTRHPAPDPDPHPGRQARAPKVNDAKAMLARIAALRSDKNRLTPRRGAGTAQLEAISARWSASFSARSASVMASISHDQQGGVHRAVDGHGRHRDAPRHLHRGVQGVDPVQRPARQRHPDDRQGRVRGDDPGQVGGHARPADEGDVARLPGTRGQLGDLGGVAVGRQHPDVGLDAEAFERLGRRRPSCRRRAASPSTRRPSRCLLCCLWFGCRRGGDVGPELHAGPVDLAGRGVGPVTGRGDGRARCPSPPAPGPRR